MKKLLLILSIIAFVSQAMGAEQLKRYNLNGESFDYKTPSSFQFITTFPKNSAQFLKNSFSFTPDNLKAWGAIIVSSAIMIHYDQQITDNVQRFGRKIGIGNAENTKATLRVGGSALLRRPSDPGSLMYFMGDGWITLGFAGSFLTAGHFGQDPRAQTVGQELLQGILLTAITTQIIKRSTGRESPIKATSPGGRWHFFPSTSTFQSNISKYDAFPSGHLATTVTTFMILSENYAEYKWIKPVGYTVMGLLSFEMVNNSVHWAGDYPLALGIGYMIGKTIIDSGRQKSSDQSQQQAITLAPILSPDGKYGVSANLSF